MTPQLSLRYPAYVPPEALIAYKIDRLLREARKLELYTCDNRICEAFKDAGNIVRSRLASVFSGQPPAYRALASEGEVDYLPEDPDTH